MGRAILLSLAAVIVIGCESSAGYRAAAPDPRVAAESQTAPAHRYDPFFDDRYSRSRYSYTVPRDGDADWHRRPR